MHNIFITQILLAAAFGVMLAVIIAPQKWQLLFLFFFFFAYKSCSHEYCPTVEEAKLTNKCWTAEHLSQCNCRKAGITSVLLTDIHRNKTRSGSLTHQPPIRSSSFCWLNVNALVLICTLQCGTERPCLTVHSSTGKLLQEESANSIAWLSKQN